MNATLAYEIGAAFFFAVLLMGGSMMRGLFPAGLFKGIRVAVMVVVIGLAGMAAWQQLPSAWAGWFSPNGSESGAVENQPEVKQAATPKHNPAAGKLRDSPYVITVKPEDLKDDPQGTEAAEVPADGPVIVRPAEAPDSRSKKVVKSVGRFLHLGHKKADGDQ